PRTDYRLIVLGIKWLVVSLLCHPLTPRRLVMARRVLRSSLGWSSRGLLCCARHDRGGGWFARSSLLTDGVALIRSFATHPLIAEHPQGQADEGWLIAFPRIFLG